LPSPWFLLISFMWDCFSPPSSKSKIGPYSPHAQDNNSFDFIFSDSWDISPV
jgi:hypothetical protein